MFRFLILTNGQPDDHKLWISACEKQASSVSYRVVNLLSDSWMEEIRNGKVDYLLAKPECTIDARKRIYDERIMKLVNEIGYKVFPSLEEILIYENKRYFAGWLKLNGIPHPETSVFDDRIKALEFAKDSVYPIVAKLNTGASGNGVTIIDNEQQAVEYIEKIFSTGVSPRTGPRMNRGNLFNRALFMLLHPQELKRKLTLYKNIASSPQKGFCLFQEFIPHTFEWRVVRIGDSFFAHKKIVKGEKASGSLIKGYENPPFSLLDFVREITDKHKFQSQAVDIFETGRDHYLVNEMQCIFGQSDPYQMLIDGKPGRYRWLKNQWIFEEGMFNTNESYDLRLETVISLLENKQSSG